MKLFVVLAAVILAVAASDLELWQQFKNAHNKTYKSIVEEKLRFSIFQNNLRTIEEHNVKFESGEKSYKMGVNKFADLTTEEFIKMHNFKTPNLKYTKVFKADPNFQTPSSIDWRDQGAVLEVKDQGQCGGSWAFSCIGSLEGQNAIKNNNRISLSEQELIDCSTRQGNKGCDGGSMENGFNYIKYNGISTENGYPYRGVDGRCTRYSRANISISGFTNVLGTEGYLLEAVGFFGPISVAINADLLQFYRSGIFNEPRCSSSVNHGALVVGYDSQRGTPYWIIKNSWGRGWGENGYFRLVRNQGSQCGIGSYNIYPRVN